MSPQRALKKMQDSLSEKRTKPADSLREGKASDLDGHVYLQSGKESAPEQSCLAPCPAALIASSPAEPVLVW